MRALTPHLLRLAVVGCSLVLAIGAAQTSRVTGIEQTIDVTSTTLANEICIVRWRADTNGLCRTAEKITEVVCLVDLVSQIYRMRRVDSGGYFYTRTSVCNASAAKLFLS